MNDTHDPYRAPSAAVGDLAYGNAKRYETASRTRRFLTYLVDMIAFYILLVPVVIVELLVFGQDSLENSVSQTLLSLAVLMGYYLVFEGLFARTPGKWACGTVVVDESGRPPSFNQVLGRSFARLIPFEAFSLLFSREEDRHGWHDSLPKTRVVLARSLA